ncbi:hypothetical protein [Nonomuraea sp. SYSU D8015]|uniref:hypothetical protein n=1 Tax=Nonomuraea sp. SYSU D8015 TaxID=2593644 RepID=UPI001660C668|nr:hypothetical protein [Nonomuraea sp. SYSU D8015]
MIRRILAGAALTAAALGFSAVGASADVGPNANNRGQGVLSQFQVIDDVLNDVANNSLNESLRDIEVDVLQVLDLHELDVDVLNNNQPSVGDGNVGSDAGTAGTHFN